MNPLTEETENRGLIVLGRYDLTVPERDLIGRGLALVDSLRKKEYHCTILNAKFVLIPAGTFMMGTPYENAFKPERLWSYDETPHQVTISKHFYMQTTEMTQCQWKKVMGNNPSYFQGDDNLPVECVSWNDVQEFILKLNKMDGMDKYRLPTEAEWEYTCRAGSKTAYFSGDSPVDLCEYAWYKDNSEKRTHPVGQKKANIWGLYDIYGNVLEWCQEEYCKYTSGSVTDPVESDRWNSSRILRGGCCYNDASDCRSAYRFHFEPDDRGNVMGFRLIRTW